MLGRHLAQEVVPYMYGIQIEEADPAQLPVQYVLGLFYKTVGLFVTHDEWPGNYLASTRHS